MNITIFKDITTEKIINDLEISSKKYEGLYIDMSNATERKYIKEKAVEIKTLVKILDRARIDKTSSYKKTVEKEAKNIKERLEVANLPFTLLIDEYAEERKKVLAEEKAIREHKELLEKIVGDHEIALLIDYKFDADIVEKGRIEREEQAEKDKINAENKRLSDIEQNELKRISKERENARIADKKHLAKVNNEIATDFIGYGIGKQTAKNVITLISRNKIRHLNVGY